MFTSNQVIAVSGTLSKSDKEMEKALEFALKLHGEVEVTEQGELKTNCTFIYQITENEKFCLGLGYSNVPDGWHVYAGELKLDSICDKIREFIEPLPGRGGPFRRGMTVQGFIMKNIEECLKSEKDGIKSPFYGIVYFEPFTCFYSK